jgi:hypothetical protein
VTIFVPQATSVPVCNRLALGLLHCAVPYVP